MQCMYIWMNDKNLSFFTSNELYRIVPRDDDKLQLVKLALVIVCNPYFENKEMQYTSGATFINMD